jgi:hypothetical protein
VFACPCGGRRRVLCFITDTDIAREILTALGLPATMPPFGPARAPPQRRFDDDLEDPASAHPGGSGKGDPNGDHPSDHFGDPPAWDVLDPA